jgi:stage II sporulation protein D
MRLGVATALFLTANAAGFSAGAATSATAPGQQTLEVRVRLRKELPSVDVSGYGLRITPPTGFIDIDAHVGLAKAKIVHTKPGVWVVRWAGSRRSQKIEAEQLWVKGQMLRLGIEPVPYDLELHENGKKGVDVIARLDMENYLMGVLPAEMPIAWPLEALKAQAVAARSFVMRNSFERRDKYFDVDSTIIDQVYKFLAEAEQHPDYKTKLIRAVKETKGEVLVDDRHRILKAFYSADCGCQTEDPRFVWGKVDDITSVKDPTCSKRRPSNWDLQLSRGEVRSRLLASLDLPIDTGLRALHVGGRTPSGRVASVIASLDVGGKVKTVDMKSQVFRRIFGFERIRSTNFSLKWMGDELEIHGSGVGHGVGLCQSGSKSLADEGMKYKDILKLYYPKAQLWTLKRT